MSSPTRLALASFAVVLAAASARAGVAVISDGQFSSGWLHQKVLDTTPGASATTTTVIQPTGGIFGPYAETTHTWANGAIVVAHYSSNYWDPSAAPVCSVKFWVTARHFTGSTVGGAVRVRPLIFQSGSTYHSVNGWDVFNDDWNTSFIEQNMVASTFVKVDGPGPDIPDFSCSGNLLVFGYSTSNSASGGPVTKVVGVDNFNVEVTYAREELVDGDFNARPWTSTKILDTSPLMNNTFTATVQGSGGNPGSYYEVSHSFANGDIFVAHMDPSTVYVPANAQVYSIDYGYDAAHFTAPPPPFVGQVAFRLAIQQGSAWYTGPTDLVGSATWTHFNRSNLIAADFALTAGTGPANPDFSTAGAPFTLGWVTATSYGGAFPVVKTSGMDNLVVLVHTAPVCGVITGLNVCDGTGASGACPCFPALPASPYGHGCANSLFPAGAVLVANGTASLANDTVVLQATAMPNSSCIYFQGTALSAAPIYDGIGCVGGSIVRLGTKTNACNSSQYPDPVNQKVSVRGQVTSAGTRYYQVWYRNAAAFCTTATSNYTNAIQINWTP